jgi:hypothetical protein
MIEALYCQEMGNREEQEEVNNAISGGKSSGNSGPTTLTNWSDNEWSNS